MTKMEILRRERNAHRLAKAGVEKKGSKEVIRTYRLREEEIAGIYREGIEVEMNRARQRIDNINLENTWRNIKDTMLKVAKEACGSVKADKIGKQSRWWSEEIKLEIKLKKQK